MRSATVWKVDMPSGRNTFRSRSDVPGLRPVDLARPLATIAPSLDAEALSVLAASETPLTVGQVAARCRRGSRPALRAVLERLARHGLVTSLPIANAVVYALNRDHLLAPVVLAAVGVRRDLAERLGAALAAWEVPAAHAALLDDIGEEVALLAVRTALDNTDRATWRAQLRDLADGVRRWTGNGLAVTELTVDELARTDAADRRRWEYDGTRLAGAALAELVAGQFVPLAWTVVPTPPVVE